MTSSQPASTWPHSPADGPQRAPAPTRSFGFKQKIRSSAMVCMGGVMAAARSVVSIAPAACSASLSRTPKDTKRTRDDRRPGR